MKFASLHVYLAEKWEICPNLSNLNSFKAGFLLKCKCFPNLIDENKVLKDPKPDENKVPVNCVDIQRLNCFFSCLINGHLLTITEKVFHSLGVIEILRQVYGKSNEDNGAYVKLLQSYVEHAWQSLREKPNYKASTDFQWFLENVVPQGLPSSLKIANVSCNQRPFRISGESQEMESLLEIQTEIRPSSEIETIDTRVL